MSPEEKIDALCGEFHDLRKAIKAVTGPVPVPPPAEPAAAPPNGSRKLVGGILSVLTVTAVVSGVGLFWSYGSRIAVVESKTEKVTDARIAVVETEATAVKADVTEIKADVKILLSRIPAKP